MQKIKEILPSISEFRKKGVQRLKDNYKMIISIAIAITLPWILTYIFIVFLNLTHGLSDEIAKDPMLLFRLTIFYTFNLPFDLSILGFGYWTCMVVWAVVGFFIGLYTRDMGKSLLSALIGIFTTFLLYLPLVYLVGVSNYRDLTINPLIFTRTYENYTSETPVFLLYHISFHSFALPVLIMFTLLGSMLNSPLKVQKSSDFGEPKKSRVNPKALVNNPGELEQVSVPELEIKREKELKGFVGLIFKQFNPLNENEIFKEKFKKISLIFLLNPIDQLTAAKVIFDKGTVAIKECKKLEPLMEMEKDLLGYDAMLQVTTQMLSDFAMGKLSILQLLKEKMKDKNIKIKGKLKLLKLKKAFNLIAKS
ncbi:MAG: hypothetical protein ACFFCM_15520 [Promethearchaeota archaeon]